MATLNHIWRNLSLRKSIACYIFIFTVLALLLSIGTVFFCQLATSKIESSYPVTEEKYYLTNETGEQLGGGVYIGVSPSVYNMQDQCLLTFLDILPTFATPIYSAGCLLAAALLFYRNKLQKPLILLEQATAQVSQSNLDFSLQYDNEDEFGHLCRSFESMRAALAQNYREMWLQMEERKRLNAAFAHDLRTPLTVLKGQNQMLQESPNMQTREAAAMMERHLSRLEHYVDSMSQLQRLEDFTPQRHTMNLPSTFTLWQQSAQLYCQRNQKQLHWQTNCTATALELDSELIWQVLDNLLANSMRYAQQHITVTWQDLSFQKNHNEQNDLSSGLLLMVSDDGPGFSKESLQKATEPYYTEQKQNAQHFGLGLTICHLLCRKHGGSLTVDNTPLGAKVTATFFEEE